MSDTTINFRLDARFIVKVVVFIIWILILYILGSFTYGALVIDHVARAFQVGLSITIIWLIIGLVGFSYMAIKKRR